MIVLISFWLPCLAKPKVLGTTSEIFTADSQRSYKHLYLRYESPLSVFTQLLSSMSTVFWPFIVYWHTENSVPFPQEASWLTSLLSASSHSCLWPLPFLAFELREHYLPSGCLTCLNGRCEEIKGKSFTLFFLNGLKLK